MAFKPINEVAQAKGRRKERAAFYTPLELVRLMVTLAHLPDGGRALEPSAGDGRIVHALAQVGARVDAFEIEESLHSRILEAGAVDVGTDFLDAEPRPEFHAVVMNPPFKGKEWKKHLEHAWRFVRPDGALVALLPADMAVELIGSDKVDLPGCDDCYHERVAADAFKEMDTSVRTALFVLGKADGRQGPRVDGFANNATWQVAVAMASDGALFEKRKTWSNAELRQGYLRQFWFQYGKGGVKENAGYLGPGIHWDEVYLYLRRDAWQDSPETAPEVDKAGP